MNSIGSWPPAGPNYALLNVENFIIYRFINKSQIAEGLAVAA